MDFNYNFMSDSLINDVLNELIENQTRFLGMTMWAVMGQPPNQPPAYFPVESGKKLLVKMRKQEFIALPTFKQLEKKLHISGMFIWKFDVYPKVRF